MTSLPSDHTLTRLLADAVEAGGFQLGVVSTDQGLVLASVGDTEEFRTVLGALTGIFDDVVARVRRDAGLLEVDEVAVRDRTFGRLVVRPAGHHDGLRIFIVVSVPRGTAWRRVTNRLCRDVAEALALRAIA